METRNFARKAHPVEKKHDGRSCGRLRNAFGTGRALRPTEAEPDPPATSRYYTRLRHTCLAPFRPGETREPSRLANFVGVGWGSARVPCSASEHLLLSRQSQPADEPIDMPGHRYCNGPCRPRLQRWRTQSQLAPPSPSRFPHNFFKPLPKTTLMTSRDVAHLTIVALTVSVTLGLACVERDWSVCTPQDPCQTGFVCTDTWQCVRATDGWATDGGAEGPAGENSGSDAAQNQPGGDASASSERGSDALGPMGTETGVDATGSMGAETNVDATGSTGAEIGAEAPIAADAASPDILHAPDAPSGALDLSPNLDAPSSGSHVPDAPLEAAPAADTAPPGSPLGATCIKPSDCALGHCSDGVCCDSACAGACEYCALVGKVGTCSYVTGSPAPGHSACGGMGICAGGCGGQGASCSLPDRQTNCGAASCTNGTAYSARTCDGAGTCGPSQSTPCGGFACGATACLSICSDNSQCAVGAACVNSKCVQCAAGETACPNLCANLQTDNADCGSCSGTGSVCSAAQQCSGGKCLLAAGQSCTTDTQCAVGTCAFFYLDNDKDGYPDSKGRSGWCGATYPLAAGFIAPRADGKWDCCDADVLVHPDQAQYFAVSTTSCSVGFDYDCSGTIEKQPMAGSEPCAFDANQVCGSAIGTPSENCGSLHHGLECQAVTTVSPPLCVSTTTMVTGTVGCH